MDSLIREYKKNKSLHHAYLIGVGVNEGEKGVILFLEREVGLKIKGNPDFVNQKFETLSIEDARNLKEMASRKALGGDKKIFVVQSNFLTREAQNSLLKLFEEPVSNTHFFIITPNADTLLPTLKSRLMVLDSGESTKNEDLTKYTKEFLKLHPSARIEAGFIKTMIEEKDKQKALEFVDYLTKALREASGKNPSSYVEAFSEIITSRNYLRDRSASVKLILENLSLVMPVLK